ncbi:MAG: glucokinase [Candidatus Cloacimonetes bacterium]|nr:glucokinase [Candidatus Cloacimonadota bacterium]
MVELNLAVDAGGTYTRLKAEILKSNDKVILSKEFKQKINSPRNLKNFILASLNEIKPGIKPTTCVIGFAGAVINHYEVEVNNWLGKPLISLDDLIKWGCPEFRTMIVNDMELAAYGILDMEDKGELNSDLSLQIYTPDTPARNRLNNKLVVAPGTGFGTASILEFVTHAGIRVKDVLSSEIQHIQLPALDKRHAEILKNMLSERPNGNYLSYEDLVSGKGLRDTFNTILKLTGKKQNKEIEASDIALMAAQGSDEYAIEALDIFYRCAGRLIQAMALMAQPFNGIYLCGASTINNTKFIQQSNFVKELHNCSLRKKLLSQFPIYLISKPDINITGGLWAGRNIL